MAITSLAIPTRSPLGPNNVADFNAIVSKINELASAMAISALTLTATLGAGNPAADMNTVVSKINGLIDILNAAPVTPKADFGGKTNNFFGDSITRGVGASSTATRWTSLLSSGYNGLESNFGVNGSTMQTDVTGLGCGRLAFDPSVIPQKTSSIKYNFFAFGVNDNGLNVPVMTPEGFRRDYVTALNAHAAKGYAYSDAVLITPFWYTNYASYVGQCGVTTAATVARHEQYVAVVRELAQTYGTRLVNVYTAMRDSPDRNTFLDPTDNLHPRDAGHAFIAQTVATAVAGFPPLVNAFVPFTNATVLRNVATATGINNDFSSIINSGLAIVTPVGSTGRTTNLGKASFTNNLGSDKCFGLTSKRTVGGLFSEIDYTLYTNSQGAYRVFVNGSLKVQQVNWSSTDVWAVVPTPETIVFTRNGDVIWTEDRHESGPLFLTTGMQSDSGIVTSIECSLSAQTFALSGF